MQSSMSSRFIIVVHVALFMVFFPVNKVSSAGLIETTCKKTPYYDLCVATLKSDPASAKADVKVLARIAAMRLLREGMRTWEQIHRMVKEAKDRQLLKALQTCRIAYDKMTADDMDLALGGITRGDLKSAIDGASDVPIQTDKCEKSFTKSPFTTKNKLVHDLSVVVVSIVKTWM